MCLAALLNLGGGASVALFVSFFMFYKNGPWLCQILATNKRELFNRDGHGSTRTNIALGLRDTKHAVESLRSSCRHCVSDTQSSPGRSNRSSEIFPGISGKARNVLNLIYHVTDSRPAELNL